MKVDPDYKSFGELFSENNVFYTPKYQRDYSWESEQIIQFCKDIKDALVKKTQDDKHQHFFGGIVCAQEEGVGNRKIDNVLVDGQQRLSSMILFFSVLSRYVDSLNCQDEEDNSFKSEILSDIKKYLVFEERKQREKILHPRISIGRSDNEFYQSALEGVVLEIERDSHRLILSAKEAFESFVKEDLLSGKTIAESLDTIDDIVKLFEDSFLLIHIITTSIDDAYKLFMVLNDRGINLTEGELLKAHTIGDFDENDPNVIQMEQDWDKMLAYESKDVSNYLRWALIMITGEHVTASDVLESYKSKYFTEEINTREMASRVRFLRKCTDKLRLISEAEWPFEDSQTTTKFHKVKLEWLIKKLKHIHVMPVLLASTFSSEREFQNIINETCKFFIRYKVVSNLHASIFSDLYPPLSKEIFDLRDRFSISVLHSKFKTVIDKKDQNGEIFRAGLESLVYKRKGDNRPIKYVLVTLQENWEWLNRDPLPSTQQRLRMENRSIVFDFNNTTLEHLYPYSAREADKVEEMERHKNKIGNLVLLDIGKNASNSDKNFVEKRKNFNNTGIGIHSFVIDKENWLEGEVDELTVKYLDYASKVFSF